MGKGEDEGVDAGGADEKGEEEEEGKVETEGTMEGEAGPLFAINLSSTLDPPGDEADPELLNLSFLLCNQGLVGACSEVLVTVWLRDESSMSVRTSLGVSPLANICWISAIEGLLEAGRA